LEEEELKRLEYTRLGFEKKRDQLIAEAQGLEEATRVLFLPPHSLILRAYKMINNCLVGYSGGMKRKIGVYYNSVLVWLKRK
jgi:hypothetical protein